MALGGICIRKSFQTQRPFLWRSSTNIHCDQKKMAPGTWCLSLSLSQLINRHSLWQYERTEHLPSCKKENFVNKYLKCPRKNGGVNDACLYLFLCFSPVQQIFSLFTEHGTWAQESLRKWNVKWECKYALWPRFLSLSLSLRIHYIVKLKVQTFNVTKKRQQCTLCLCLSLSFSKLTLYFVKVKAKIFIVNKKRKDAGAGLQVPLARKSATHREAQLENVLEFKIQRAPHYNFSWHFISLWQNPESTAS